MKRRRVARQGFSQARLVFWTLGFVAVNGLLLTCRGSTIDHSLQWIMILGLDSFLLALGILFLFRARDRTETRVEQKEAEIAAVIEKRLHKYVAGEKDGAVGRHEG